MKRAMCAQLCNALAGTREGPVGLSIDSTSGAPHGCPELRARAVMGANGNLVAEARHLRHRAAQCGTKSLGTISGLH